MSKTIEEEEEEYILGFQLNMTAVRIVTIIVCKFIKMQILKLMKIYSSD